MRLTVTTLSGDFFNVDIAEDIEIENLVALCKTEANMQSSQIVLLWNGQPLQDKQKRLTEYGIKEGDVLLLQQLQARPPQQQPQQQPRNAHPELQGLNFGEIQIPGTSSQTPRPRPTAQAQSDGLPEDPARLRELLLANPHQLSILKEHNPPLAEALLSGSLEKFTEVYRKQQRERAQREAEQIQLMNADPFDMNAQQKIAEQIRLKNVESNMEAAMEFSPESFGQVVMLYIDCNVNGHPVKAFVDSGAQMTIMSQACAERCGIMRLVDKRWAGIAKGVGTQKIIGRVHLCQIQIEQDFLQTAFSILEEQPMDMLLGLDMLKRHQCTLDLRQNCLLIGTTGTQTKFLGESELPPHARLNRSMSETDPDLADAMNKSAAEAASHAGASTSHNPAPAPSTFPEASIASITANGFSRQQAIDELTKANGNVDQAIAALIAKSFSMPSS